MKHISLLFLIALFSVTISGCTTEIVNTSQNANLEHEVPTISTEEAKSITVDFEVLEGWEVKHHASGSAYRGIRYEQPEDSFAHYISFDIDDVKRGSAADAKTLIKESYELLDKDVEATFSEVVIGGKTIYIEEERTSNAYGGPWWSNYVGFEKDGWVVTFLMTDRVQNQKEAIELLIETIEVEDK